MCHYIQNTAGIRISASQNPFQRHTFTEKLPSQCLTIASSRYSCSDESPNAGKVEGTFCFFPAAHGGLIYRIATCRTGVNVGQSISKIQLHRHWKYNNQK